jgi:hypothetical protein
LISRALDKAYTAAISALMRSLGAEYKDKISPGGLILGRVRSLFSIAVTTIDDCQGDGLGGLRDKEAVSLLLVGLASLSSFPLGRKGESAYDGVVLEISSIPKDEWTRLISFTLKHLSHIEGKDTGFSPSKGLGKGGGTVSVRRRGYTAGWYNGVAALVEMLSNLTDGLAASTSARDGLAASASARDGLSVVSSSSARNGCSPSDGLDKAHDGHTSGFNSSPEGDDEKEDSTLRTWIFITATTIICKVFPTNTDLNDSNNHKNTIKNQVLEDLLSGSLPPLASLDVIPPRGGIESIAAVLNGLEGRRVHGKGRSCVYNICIHSCMCMLFVNV